MSDGEQTFGLPDDVPLGVGDVHANSNGRVMVFEPLRAFLARELPPAESLVGVPRDGTNLLPRFGWVLVWGPAGAAKTSVLVDLLFHAAAGIDWLGWRVERPLRLVAIVNEGVPGGFQDKLRQKLERWPHAGRETVLDNLSMYASPWGEFTFADERMSEHAREYALAVGADYVALDPLHTLGTVGGGTPNETEAFKHLLRAFGLWQDLGVVTAHHSNKAGMVSGDWARHADTVLHLEKEPKRPTTRLTIEKARPADPAEHGVPQRLEWDVETFGYSRTALDAAPVGDLELLERIVAKLVEVGHPLSMRELRAKVEGTNSRVGEVAKRALTSGELVNLSPKRNTYAFALPESGSRAYEPAEPLPGFDAQTGMDTDDERFGTGRTALGAEGALGDGGESGSAVRPPCKGGEPFRTEPLSTSEPEPSVDDDVDDLPF